MRKPQRRVMVFTGEVLLNPWKRRAEARRVQVVKVT